MPDADEAPMEHIHHEAHQSHGNKGESWIGWAALTAAIFAAIAAIGGSLASESLNEANTAASEALDKWNYFQAKGNKETTLAQSMKTRELIDRRLNLLQAQLDGLKGQATTAPAETVSDAKDAAQITKYEKEKEDIQKEATECVQNQKKATATYNTLEHGETLFHIAIAIVAIAVLSKRRSFWYFSLLFGVAGGVLILKGFMSL
jgi:hypothetical protein